MLVPEINGPIGYHSIHNNSKNDTDFTEFDSSIDNKLPHQKMK